jgi:hypothetical protein
MAMIRTLSNHYWIVSTFLATFILLISSEGCKHIGEQKVKMEWTLVESSDTITIPLGKGNDENPFRFLGIQFWGDKGKHVLGYLSDSHEFIELITNDSSKISNKESDYHSIHIESITCGEFGKEVTTERFDGFYIESPDSIFVLRRDELFLINSDGDCLKHWTIPTNSFPTRYFAPTLSSRFFIDEGLLTIPVYYRFPPNQFKKIFEQKTISCFKLHDDGTATLRKSVCKYPEVYREGEYYYVTGQITSCQIDFKGNIYCSFPVSPMLLTASMDCEDCEGSIIGESKYIREHHGLTSLESLQDLSEISREQFADYAATEPKYNDIFYLKKPNLLVRSALHRTKLLDDSNDRIRYKDKSWSIILIEPENKKIVKEVEFPGKVYYFDHIMTTESSLLVPLQIGNKEVIQLVEFIPVLNAIQK